MKHFLFIPLFAMLGGCAMSPMDLKERGNREQFSMRLAPADAAACVARNTENSGNSFAPGANTTVRAGAEPGHVELVAFNKQHYYLTADFAPASAGSTATAWISPHLLEFARNRLVGAFQGC